MLGAALAWGRAGCWLAGGILLAAAAYEFALGFMSIGWMACLAGLLTAERCGRPLWPGDPDVGRLRLFEPRLRDRWFEELDRVARRILDEDLLAADPDDDLVAEVDAALTQAPDKPFQIVYLELKTIPAARLRQ